MGASSLQRIHSTAIQKVCFVLLSCHFVVYKAPLWTQVKHRAAVPLVSFSCSLTTLREKVYRGLNSCWVGRVTWQIARWPSANLILSFVTSLIPPGGRCLSNSCGADQWWHFLRFAGPACSTNSVIALCFTCMQPRCGSSPIIMRRAEQNRPKLRRKAHFHAGYPFKMYCDEERSWKSHNNISNVRPHATLIRNETFMPSRLKSCSDCLQPIYRNN